MRICELYGSRRPVISFEVFPPKKKNGLETIMRTLEKLTGLSPDYISVTYGAGGRGALDKTKEIAAAIKNTLGVEALAHLTCITSSRDEIGSIAQALKEANLKNILALRGDLPQDPESELSKDYRYAQDLIRDLKERGDFCIGGACYPEGHIDCQEMGDNIAHLREKEEAGADFFVSQLFFDNSQFYQFMEKTRKAGVKNPISAGVMPILSKEQIERMIFMCGVSLPSRIIKILHRYENDPVELKKAGIDYSVEQVMDLIDHGVDGVHIYTMNKPSIAQANMAAIRDRKAQ